jgi:hypothetical protein
MQTEIITYVYIDKEVKLTGRLAKAPAGSRVGDMVEVVPVSANITDKEYARWVNMKELHTVKNLEDEDIE